MSDRDDLIRVYQALKETREQLAAVTKERDELRRRAQELTEENRVQSEVGDTFSEMQQALRVLRRDLATAVEALEWYATRLPYGELARAVLSAIHGTEPPPECTCDPADMRNIDGPWQGPNCPQHGRRKR